MSSSIRVRFEVVRHSVAMRALAWGLVGLAGLTGCGEDRFTVFVDVVTTHPPGVQFDRVVTTLSSPAGEVLETVELEASAGDPYATGVRVAEIADVAEGSYRVEVELSLGGATVASRGTSIDVKNDVGVTISLAASCSDESCNALDDDCDGIVDEGEPATLCALAGVEAAACVAGSCEIGACVGAMLDCDMDAANGCEVDGSSDDASCGACGAACAEALHCDRALCRAGGRYVAHAVLDGLEPEAVVADGERGWVAWQGARAGSFFGGPLGDLGIRGFDAALGERYRLALPGSLGMAGATGGVMFRGVAVDERGHVHVLVAAGQAGSGSYVFPGGSQPLADSEVVMFLIEYDETGTYVRHRLAPGDLGAAPPSSAFDLPILLVGALGDTLYVAGDASARLDLGDGDPIPARSAFLAAIGASNEIVWKRVVTGSDSVSIEAAVVGPSGQTLAVFHAPSSTVDFGGGAVTVTPEITTVVLYDAAGAFVWQNRYRGQGRALAFGPDGGFVFVAAPAGEEAILFETRGPGGELLHTSEREIRRLVTGAFDLDLLAVGRHGDIYLTGTLGVAVDFGGGTRSALLDAMAVVAYAADGGYRYDRHWSDPGTSRGLAIASSGDRVVLGGAIAGELDLGGGVTATADGEGAGLLLLLED